MTSARRASDLVTPMKHLCDASPATRLATAKQQRLAVGIAIFISIVTIILLPIAQSPWPKIQAFLPAYQTAYLITAYLMYGHFQASRS